MKRDLDTERALLTPSQLEELCRAIFEGGIRDETNWLEWKSFLDLAHREHRFEAARQIVAFANRQPDDALAYCEGYAYLVVGVEPNDCQGVPVIDAADVVNKLEPWLGRDGPQWQAHNIPFEGKNVLVFIVAPPHWGDDIHHTRKTSPSDRHPAASVFARDNGRTLLASPADFRMLLDRARRQDWTNLEVEPCGSILRAELNERAANDWVVTEREVLLGSMRGAEQELRAEPGAYEASPGESFSQSVEEYLETASARVLKIAEHGLAWSHPAGLSFYVSNPTPRNISGLELTLHLPEGIRVISPSLVQPLHRPVLNRREIPGPSGLLRLEQDDLEEDLVGLWPPEEIYKAADSIVVDTSHGLRIRFRRAIRLRPYSEVVLGPFILYVDQAYSERFSINISWEAVSDLDGVAKGTVHDIRIQQRKQTLANLVQVGQEEGLKARRESRARFEASPPE